MIGHREDLDETMTEYLLAVGGQQIILRGRHDSVFMNIHRDMVNVTPPGRIVGNVTFRQHKIIFFGNSKGHLHGIIVTHFNKITYQIKIS